MSTDTANNLAKLNDRFFEQLDRLSAADLKGEQLKEEIERTRAITGLGREMIENGKLALEAVRTIGGKPNSPAMLRITE